ncbi:dienelactone hydrolase endo-1,3,1,4-beta-D-glucanase [Lentinula edodes]|nr:dienelactone hydrolase endo-1,3,1,4-beta-D-glucanase [Lentinula edodes]
MSFCDECFKGVTHEGTPKGKWEKIGGIDCYVGIPSGIEYPKDKVLLFLSDVFGMQLINNQLLVDDFADNGILTYGVDYFFGEPIPADAMQPGSTFDRDAWREKHGYQITRPAVDAVVAALKEKGVMAFGTTGYCFGAAYAVPLAIENVTQVTAVSHPSRLKVPEDLEKYCSVSKAPFLINSCEEDAMFPAEAQAKADVIFGDGKFAPGYRREYFPGCKHGFAVRGDMSDPMVKAGKEGAFKSTVDWIKKYL